LRQVSSRRVNAQKEANTARRLSILIADDEPDTVATLSAILSDEGHVVHHVYRGDEVAQALKRYKPEVCILDIEMPGRNGYELAKEISAAAGRPVLIAISGKYVQESERHLALAMGFERFFVKPADPQKLLALIEQIGGGEAAGEIEVRRERALRILIADDNRDTVATTAALLRDEGYEVREAHNGKDAMVGIADFDPDVVVADINMPGLSGWQLAKAVRRVSGYRRPLLVAISGHYNAAADRVLTDMSGFNHFLPKPFDMKDLLALIERRN
jgi:DNA-binding response OmpR family regulator